MQPSQLDAPVWAIGIMSGTSLDGVDVALLKTDGKTIAEFGESLTVDYPASFQESISLVANHSDDVKRIERDFTLRCINAVEQLLEKAGKKASEIKAIGFHGQTIDHRPDEGITWQIGSPALLAAHTGIDVVADFRSKDIALGGQGAPLVPLFHAAMAHDLPKPMAIVNIGGVANVTWIDDELHSPWILAFDTGPGNALINDMVDRRTGTLFDEGGKLAAAGKADQTAIDGYLYDTYFAKPPPKSLDRYDFGVEPVLHMETEDAIATLTEFTAQSIAKSVDFMPFPPMQWFVAGGGRHNPTLMKRLNDFLMNVQPVEKLGWSGDALEAQAFAFLAVRSLQNLPITLPTLTGVHQPASGGAFYPA